MMTETQIRHRIEELKIEIKVLENVLKAEPDVKTTGRPKGTYQYTQERIDFLTENKDMKMNDLIDAYNGKFNTDVPKNSRALYNFMVRTGILKQQFKRADYNPRSPEAVERSKKTKEEKFLKEVGINENREN